jgi:hypothetical protein
MPSSADVRDALTDSLVLDLVGPTTADHPLATELLPQGPSRWYLTGFLVPVQSDAGARTDPESVEDVDAAGERGGTDDAVTPEPAAAGTTFLPSSMGMSLLVSGATKRLGVEVSWGDYRRESVDGDGGKKRSAWRRVPQRREVEIDVPPATPEPRSIEVPESGGLRIALSVRPVDGMGLPAGTRSVSVFLVNDRRPVDRDDPRRDETFVFQAELRVRAAEPLVPRPDMRAHDTTDWDERVADLQCRDVFEWAVGHNVAAVAVVENGECRQVTTCWIPSAEVERVTPASVEGVELGMEALTKLGNVADARVKLGGIVERYRAWIETQRRTVATLTGKARETGEDLLRRAEVAAKRIEAGIALLGEPIVREAFCVANSAMARSGRQRRAMEQGVAPEAVKAPEWRPFQLAFLLMNLRGVVEPTHPDRENVDLLFFPTGGGKTEAYLGLAAFTLVLRRLRNDGYTSAGLCVLMRYTLRLLTLDQLGRAATLICALELEREAAKGRLGPWPFEIGLWVGLAATPNVMGRKGDGRDDTARIKALRYQADSKKNPSPIPIEECPWCGTKFAPLSFKLSPNSDSPTELLVRCASRTCEFRASGPRMLPIVAVDEPVYRRLPCFLIATVDKFAAMPWTGEVGAFFGRVDRYDADGFYGPCSPGRGRPLPSPLPPPELIIQDELHLISGPMGTMVGLYETALDTLSSRTVERRLVRPKIVASTATVRRAESQIRALFARVPVDVFPPQGPDRRDSFFARTVAETVTPARRYVGVAAQGRSLKVVLLRVYRALLAAAQKAWIQNGGEKTPENPADPYMTLIGYFGSLRELGGSRRIVEDEVRTVLAAYGARKRVGESEGLFSDRDIAYEVLELTSRVSTDAVAQAKRRLAQRFNDKKERVDVALATNMISVGLDITRLGLMVVLGQPKTSAEYIQATSRVGRDETKPGLIVTLLNVHRPRDRSHYERFVPYHQSFYRAVEATSVTPFSPRALDRGLAGTLVGLARLGDPILTAPLGADAIVTRRGALGFAVAALAERARAHRDLPPEEAEALAASVTSRADRLLDLWSTEADSLHKVSGRMQYQREVGAATRLLYEFLNPALETVAPVYRNFRANRSMRDVEPNVNLWVQTLEKEPMSLEEDE